MKVQHNRTAMLFGEDAVAKLQRCHAAVFGIGGVGAYVAEALARSGVGKIDLIDSDVVSESNINRQLIALHSTVGKPKTEVMAERIRDIDPDIQVRAINMFYLPENAEEIDITQYDIIIDAIDTVSSKINLAVRAQEHGVKIISSMGTGNKVDPTALKISDIYKTSVCPLARVMRNELKKRGVKKLTVVWSDEVPRPSIPLEKLPEGEAPTGSRRATPASCAFVPSAAGLIIASEAVRQLIEE
ncbi:MAG: tRNA threonylcarbamoyladenosine dehydratase [Clostridia bacterium]|nr:tRNA threonylcarbamoyladenosine dehydratase [Clostridia bacterium]